MDTHATDKLFENFHKFLRTQATKGNSQTMALFSSSRSETVQNQDNGDPRKSYHIVT